MPLPQGLSAASLVRAVAVAAAIALVPQAAGQQPPTIPSSIRVGAARGSSFDVTVLPLETYVARVVAGEGDPQSSAAALQALAITVRTFAVANRTRHNGEGFDVCDQTHCQVLRPSTPATERAAQATAGQVLTYRGDIASVFYSASCGGYTERPSAVWPGAEDPPYLPSRKDDACEGEPAWTDDIPRTDLARALGSAGFRGTLREVQVAERDASGRVSRLSLAGMTPPEMSGQDLRTAVARTLGAQHVKSAAFDVRRSGETFTFSGHGFGHGVGMCVIGSVNLARSGESARQILAHYFPGAEITAPVERTTRAAEPVPVPQPSAAQNEPPRVAPPAARPGSVATALSAAVVSLPAGDVGEAGPLQTLALGARDDIARTLGVPAPSRVSVTFHATTEEFERATGRAWFTSAAVVDQQIHLVPLASLRERGVLERMIRRELVHLMVDGPLAGRPAWVREGAALYFSDPRGGGVPSRVSCPSDADLLSPISPGALADAYARARSCFARQIAAGRSWKDVR